MYFFSADKFLCKHVSGTDKQLTFIISPCALVKYILKQAHDALGHDDIFRIYYFVRILYD